MDKKNKKIVFIIISIILIIGICLLIFINTRTYHIQKPEDIKHYEKIRDELTINTTDNIINSTCNPCPNNFTGNETALFNILTLVGIVGLVYAVLNVFGLAGQNYDIKRNKKGVNFILGIIGLIIRVVIFSNVFITVISSINTSSVGCC